MINRERLLAINNLELAGVITNMGSRQLAQYEQNANSFIDKFPKYETVLKSSLANEEYGLIEKNLTEIQGLLKELYAGKLAESCHKIMDDLKSTEKKTRDASLTLFLSTLSMLSIDLQVAQHPDIEEKTPAVTLEAKTPPPAAPAKPVLPPLIMAVDDIPMILNNLKYILADTQYRFMGVSSGRAALKYILKHDPPDLFILDIEMPGMSGIELAQKIRECHIQSPIIFLTGYAARDYVLKAMQSGAQEFMVKPFTTQQVLTRIDNQINRYRQSMRAAH